MTIKKYGNTWVAWASVNNTPVAAFGPTWTETAHRLAEAIGMKVSGRGK